MLQRLLLMIRLVRVLMMRGHDFPSYSYPITRCSLQPSMHLCRALILEKKDRQQNGLPFERRGRGVSFRFVSLPRVKHRVGSSRASPASLISHVSSLPNHYCLHVHLACSVPSLISRCGPTIQIRFCIIIIITNLCTMVNGSLPKHFAPPFKK